MQYTMTFAYTATTTKCKHNNRNVTVLAQLIVYYFYMVKYKNKYAFDNSVAKQLPQRKYAIVLHGDKKSS